MDLDQLVDDVYVTFDKNEDGNLDSKEARAFFDALFAAAGESIGSEAHAQIYDGIDANDDNRVSKEELRAILKTALES